MVIPRRWCTHDQTRSVVALWLWDCLKWYKGREASTETEEATAATNSSQVYCGLLEASAFSELPTNTQIHTSNHIRNQFLPPIAISLTNALLQRNGDIDIIYHTGIRLLLPGLSDMRYLSIYLHRIGNPIFFWRYYERNLRSEDATKNNVLAKGKERYYCRWSVDVGSFEYTGFKLQWIMTIYIVL